jgi:hypothetical protein
VHWREVVAWCLAGYISLDASIEIPVSRPQRSRGRYVVVGGLAVVLHGHLGATGDLTDIEALLAIQRLRAGHR